MGTRSFLLRHGTAAALALSAALVPGCTVYEVAPGAYVTTPPGAFDRSWAAVVGAFQDQSVAITVQDRATGSIRGSRDGIDVAGTVRTQADGSVRVEFNTSGATARDPGLIERISAAYDRRMGR
ncbi:MAG: hypothetical protein ACREM3_04180 [Candidatus Rokuibacteriota bacterium]